MPPETEHKLDALLKSCAQKRREEAGGDFELHPATRRLLLGEVARNFPKRKGDPIQWRFVIPRVWGRTMSLAGLLFMVGLTAWAIKTFWGNLPTIDDVTATPKGQFAFSLRKQAADETNTISDSRTNSSRPEISDLALLDASAAKTASRVQSEQRHARSSLQETVGTRGLETGRVTGQAIPPPAASAPSVARSEAPPATRQDFLSAKGVDDARQATGSGGAINPAATGALAAKATTAASVAPPPPNPVGSKVASEPQSTSTTAAILSKPTATDALASGNASPPSIASTIPAPKSPPIQQTPVSRPAELATTTAGRIIGQSANKPAEAPAASGAPVVALAPSRQVPFGSAEGASPGSAAKRMRSATPQDSQTQPSLWRFASLDVTASSDKERKREATVLGNDSDLALRAFSATRQVRTPLLTRFEFKRNGTNVTLVDADGSIYEGAIIPSASSTITPGLSEHSDMSPDVARRLGGLAVGLEVGSKSEASAPKLRKPLFAFKASGRSITLGQPVLVTGSMYDETEPASQGAGSQRENASGADGHPRKLRLEGNYRVAEGVEQTIQASRVN